MARAQTFTLEGFVAALILVAAVAFALQAVSVSSNTAGATDAELRSQHAGLAAGVLEEAAADGSLRATLVHWDDTSEAFHDAADTHYVGRSPPTAFGASLAEPFADRPVRYNVDLYVTAPNGTVRRQRLVESGTPDDDAVRASETVTLYDDTRLRDSNGTERSVTLSDVESTFYAPDADPDGPTYNVVRVEVVLWGT